MFSLQRANDQIFNGFVNETGQPTSVEHYVYSIDPGIEHGAEVLVRFTVTEDDTIPSLVSVHDTTLVRQHETPKSLFKDKGSTIISTLVKRIEHISTKYTDFLENNRDNSHVVIQENSKKNTKDIPAILVAIGTIGVLPINMKKTHVFNPKDVWQSMKSDAGWKKGQPPFNQNQKKTMTREYVLKVFNNVHIPLSNDACDAILNALYFAKKNNYFSSRPRKYTKKK